MRNNISREHKLFLQRKESAELLRSIINELNNEHNKGALLVVEGKKDQLALQSLGLHVNCFWLSKEGFSNFLNIAESSKKVILLLDYDRKGKYMYARATRILQNKGIQADGFYRKAIKKITKGELVHIEEISIYSRLLG
jgi:5S rRNA maturation endonuclease (ribonuclease M5)